MVFAVKRVSQYGAVFRADHDPTEFANGFAVVIDPAVAYRVLNYHARAAGLTDRKFS